MPDFHVKPLVAPDEPQVGILGASAGGSPQDDAPALPRDRVEGPGVPLLRAALSALDRAAVPVCLLRAVDPAGPVVEADLLTAPEALPALADAVRGPGFAAVPSPGRGTHVFFVAYDRDADRWIKLDVVTELAYGRFQELPTDLAPGCLERARDAGPDRGLDPTDELWTLLLHCVLDKRQLRPDQQAVLQERALSPRADTDVPPELERLWPSGWDAERVLALVRAGSWDELLALGPPLARAMRRRRRLDAARRSLGNRVSRKLGRLPGPRSRDGLRIALLGPDGAGKSTLCEGLVRSSYLPARLLYAGLYPRSRRRRSLPGLGLLTRLARLRWLALVSRWHVACGRLVVFDRYAYDALVGAPASELPARRRLLARASPAPDLAIVLDAPGALLYDRKREHSPEFLERQRAGYLTLDERLSDSVVIDASRDADAVRREALALIWQRYGGRAG